MALIKCPECDTEISDTCVTCPKCGYRLKTMSNKSINLVIIISIIVCIISFVGYCIHLQYKHQKALQQETEQLKRSKQIIDEYLEQYQ